MAAETEKRCGDCAFWRTPKCSYSSSKKGDRACSDFYPRPGDKKKPKKLYKDSGTASAERFEAIYYNENPAFLICNGKSFSIAESVRVNEETFYPKEARQIPYEPYGYFEAEVPNREELFQKV